MSDSPNVESTHERRVTWSLIGTVVVFVLLMTCIVVWITSSLIKQRSTQIDPTGGQTSSGSEERPGASGPVALTALSTTGTQLTTSPPVGNNPNLVELTWTPRSVSGRFARFVYWYSKPSKIQLGECVEITWVTEFAVELKLYRNEDLIVDNAPPAATLRDCPTELGYAVYKLVVLNKEGTENFIKLQVKVEESP